MKNAANWKPSKFVYRKGKLKASRNPGEVGISSRLVVDLVAEFYSANLSKYANGKLLDLGCGKVPFYEAYKPFITANVCVDWENSIHKNDYLDFNANLNQPLPIESNSFDTIILSDVLEHIKEPKLLVNEMGRIMVSGGILFLNVPFFYVLHEEPNDYYRYTHFALTALLSEAGFKIVSLNTLGGVPEILADITSKNIIRVPVIGEISAIIIQKLTWLFVKTSWGKKISSFTSRRFPFGYALIAKKI